jgi:hypothetical protein
MHRRIKPGWISRPLAALDHVGHWLPEWRRIRCAVRIELNHEPLAVMGDDASIDGDRSSLATRNDKNCRTFGDLDPHASIIGQARPGD